jgi:hypothetical protein
MSKESSVNNSKGSNPMETKLHQIRGYSIVTEFWNLPPVPYRTKDWGCFVALIDGEWEGEYGYGNTREEAIEDLIEELELLNSPTIESTP